MDLLEKICRLPNKYNTFFEMLRNSKNIPSGQAEGVWYDFFVDTLNSATEATIAA